MRDPLFENKLVALVLIAALIVFGAPLIVDRLILGHSPYKHAGPAPEIAAAPADPAFAERYAAASAAAGERAAALCRACHSVEKGAPAAVGPNLWGVVGHRAASFPGFSYSPALQALDRRWSLDELDRFLADSQSYAPGTYMAISLSNPERRADVVKYLATLSDTPPAE